MCLDKDMKVKGNKVYSKDTCIFIDEATNVKDMLDRRWGKK